MSPKVKAMIAYLRTKKKRIKPSYDNDTIVKAVVFNQAIDLAIETIYDIENNKFDEKILKELQEFYDGQ